MRNLLITLALALSLSGCSDRPGQIVRREGQPDVVPVAEEDPVMNAAIKNATSTLPSFKAVLAAPPASTSGFAVKVAFPYGSNSAEHIWLVTPSILNGRVSGVVNNEPVNVTTVKLGQQVSARETQVSDWLYIQDGVLHGGYTVRVLLDRTPPEEREREVRAMGVRLE